MKKYIIQDDKINDICKKIEDLTNINNHTEALITACNIYSGNLQEIKKALEAVKVIHNYYGFLTEDLKNTRNRISTNLFIELDSILNKDQFKKIRNSF
jgi:hypothetical protein